MERIDIIETKQESEAGFDPCLKALWGKIAKMGKKSCVPVDPTWSPEIYSQVSNMLPIEAFSNQEHTVPFRRDLNMMPCPTQG